VDKLLYAIVRPRKVAPMAVFAAFALSATELIRCIAALQQAKTPGGVAAAFTMASIVTICVSLTLVRYQQRANYRHIFDDEDQYHRLILELALHIPALAKADPGKDYSWPYCNFDYGYEAIKFWSDGAHYGCRAKLVDESLLRLVDGQNRQIVMYESFEFTRGSLRVRKYPSIQMDDGTPWRGARLKGRELRRHGGWPKTGYVIPSFNLRYATVTDLALLNQAAREIRGLGGCAG